MNQQWKKLGNDGGLTTQIRTCRINEQILLQWVNNVEPL